MYFSFLRSNETFKSFLNYQILYQIVAKRDFHTINNLFIACVFDIKMAFCAQISGHKVNYQIFHESFTRGNQSIPI